ncbi:MFS transporter [Cupriavidus sp. YR651]|uniref:MFS transporter n=1 Tax=Cupriavidus sp. YR651 TaxID=1855315 RepID=UPI0015A265B5|nr:MFS transporter [Cupriavidus sp. YR651]
MRPQWRAFIDGAALTVILRRLRADFRADLASVQWILNGYVLALASLTLIGGVLSDVYGKASMLTLGCILFGLASAVCALVLSPLWLIGATHPRNERSQAIGL